MTLLKNNARFRFLFKIDAIALLVVVGLQALYLDYISVKNSEEYSKLSIFVTLDIAVVVCVWRAFVLSYQYFSQKQQDFPDHAKKWYQQGTLPMIYFTWFLYVIVLLAKLTYVCSRLDVSKENPQIIQVCLACSTIVFFLLVENHNWGKKSSESYSFTTGVCKKNGIEIFDSVEMLELLLTPGKLTFGVKFTLFILASFNFVLPTLSLYRLSLSEFGTKTTPACFSLKVLQNVLRFIFVDVPFFVIRLHIWIVHQDLSIFLMKNFFNIVVALRELYLDVCIYFKSNSNSNGETYAAPVNENIPLGE